jgi:hypothetical protein
MVLAYITAPVMPDGIKDDTWQVDCIMGGVAA